MHLIPEPDNQIPEWLKYLLAVLILPALAGAWKFLSGQGWTFFSSNREADNAHRRNQQDAALTALAKEAATSNSQVLSLNERFVSHLLEVDRVDLVKILDKLGTMHGILVKLETMGRLQTQDWSKMTEILEDIDTVMQQLTEEVRAIREERLNGSKSNGN